MNSLSLNEDYAILICLQNDIPLVKSNIKQIEEAINDKKQMKKIIGQIKNQQQKNTA